MNRLNTSIPTSFVEPSLLYSPCVFGWSSHVIRCFLRSNKIRSHYQKVLTSKAQTFIITSTWNGWGLRFLCYDRRSQPRSLTPPMLRLLSSEAQGCKDFWKSSKPCHIGIHLAALAENTQMTTHVPGFQSFFKLFASFCIGQIRGKAPETNLTRETLPIVMQDVRGPNR